MPPTNDHDRAEGLQHLLNAALFRELEAVERAAALERQLADLPTGDEVIHWMMRCFELEADLRMLTGDLRDIMQSEIDAGDMAYFSDRISDWAGMIQRYTTKLNGQPVTFTPHEFYPHPNVETKCRTCGESPGYYLHRSPDENGAR